jgi:hypothetical protein
VNQALTAAQTLAAKQLGKLLIPSWNEMLPVLCVASLDLGGLHLILSESFLNLLCSSWGVLSRRGSGNLFFVYFVIWWCFSQKMVLNPLFLVKFVPF